MKNKLEKGADVTPDTRKKFRYDLIKHIVENGVPKILKRIGKQAVTMRDLGEILGSQITAYRNSELTMKMLGIDANDYEKWDTFLIEIENAVKNAVKNEQKRIINQKTETKIDHRKFIQKELFE